jgi:hypothetical protein
MSDSPRRWRESLVGLLEDLIGQMDHYLRYKAKPEDDAVIRFNEDLIRVVGGLEDYLKMLTAHDPSLLGHL